MKFLQFLSKRRRRLDRSPKSKGSCGGDATTSTTTTADETSSSAGSRDDRGTGSSAIAHGPSRPSWNADNFLVDGPIDDDDWWEDNDGDDSSSDESSEDEQNGVPSPPLKTGSSRAIYNPYEGKRFCNRGLETWTRARQVWVEGEPSVSRLRKSPPIPATFRKELIKCLSDRRQFELSQRIGLGCVIDAYTQVWNEGTLD